MNESKHYLMHACLFVITIFAVIIANLLTPLVTVRIMRPKSENMYATVSEGTRIDIMADYGYQIVASSKKEFSLFKDSEGILMYGILNNNAGPCPSDLFCARNEVVGASMENRQLFHIIATRAEKPLRLRINPLSVKNQDQIYWVKFTLTPAKVTAVRWLLFMVVWCFFWPTLTRPVIGHFKRKDL